MVESKKRIVCMRILICPLLLLFYSLPSFSQDSYWQQNIKYDMNIDFDHENHQFDIHQEITYTNNSPDVLTYLWVQLDQNMRAKDSDTYKISTSSIDERSTLRQIKSAMGPEVF